MRTKLQTVATLACVPAIILMLTACSSKPKEQAAEPGANRAGESLGHSSTLVTIQPGEPGGVAVQTHQKTATVAGIDKEKRQVTLVAPDGVQTVVKAGPQVANFDQIQVGDRVKATIAEELVVFVRKSGEPAAADGQSTMVALAPVGAKPGVVVADTVEIAGKVTAIDLAHHQATLEFADGQSKTFKVRDDVDLSQCKVGEEVVIRSTRAMALQVEKP